MGDAGKGRPLNAMGRGGEAQPELPRTFPFGGGIGEAHQLMSANAHPPGNMAILVNAPTEGMTELP